MYSSRHVGRVISTSLFPPTGTVKVAGNSGRSVYGDQTGLVGLTAINRSLTVSQNVDDVLASIPGIHGKLNLNDEGLLPVLAA